MGDGKRRRSHSRSPPPPRSRQGGYDSLHDGRSGSSGGQGGRNDRDREFDRQCEHGREVDRDRGSSRGGTSSDRQYDRSGGGGGRAVNLQEPSSDAAGPRFGSDRERERERDRREGRREWDDRRGNIARIGVNRGAEDASHDGGGEWGRSRGHRVDDTGAGAGVGDSGREMKRKLGANGDQHGGGSRGGGRDSEASRYMSAEEREKRQRLAEDAAKPKAPKEQPNLGLSGKLAAETNKVAGGVELKHVPPPEARLPDKRWRLYIFKNDQLQDEPYRIHRMNHYLFGRDVHVADIITAHPSCSKQHAVLQFRLTQKDDEVGRPVSAVRPYLLDLGSVNGTFLNGERLEPLRYYELMEKDVVRLGQSTREYVLLHDKSGDE